MIDVIRQAETISFPTSPEGLRTLGEDFTRFSHRQVFYGCVGLKYSEGVVIMY